MILKAIQNDKATKTAVQNSSETQEYLVYRKPIQKTSNVELTETSRLQDLAELLSTPCMIENHMKVQ